MEKDTHNINKSFKEYNRNLKGAKEKKSFESFIKAKIINKKNKKNHKVNFIDDLDKNKNIAEIINIQAYKDLGDSDILDENMENMENFGEVNIEQTNDLVSKLCTCLIF